MVIVDDQGGNGFPLSEIWVWVTVHGPHDQSITALNGIPLLAQQEQLARRLANAASQVAQASGKPQRLIRLACAEVMDQVDP